MVNPSIQIIKVMRPRHWIKNLSLFAALIFSGGLLNRSLFTITAWAFIAFSLISSSVYIINDILDRDSDRMHPIKKSRPIAAGKLGRLTAFAVAITLAFFSLSLASQLNQLFFYMIAGYFALQLGYSLILKSIAIVDILSIASGFIIRVYSGAVLIDAHLSVWFLLCVVSVALFLASGKRRAELGVMGKTSRKTLRKYSKELLNSYVTMFGNAAWLSWALFTFFEGPTTRLPLWIFLAEISKTTTISKLLMITVPVAIFAIMKYESIIFEDRSESPESILLKDRGLVFSVGLWVLMVVWILYSGAPVMGI